MWRGKIISAIDFPYYDTMIDLLLFKKPSADGVRGRGTNGCRGQEAKQRGGWEEDRTRWRRNRTGKEAQGMQSQCPTSVAWHPGGVGRYEEINNDGVVRAIEAVIRGEVMGHRRYGWMAYYLQKNTKNLKMYLPPLVHVVHLMQESRDTAGQE